MISIIGHSKKNPHRIEYSSFIFSGGEIQVRLDLETEYPEFDELIVEAQLSNSDDIMELLLVCDALREPWRDVRLIVKIGYLPYARQDRICAKGEAYSSYVMSGVLSLIYAHKIIVLDPHSRDAIKGFHNLEVREPGTLLAQADELMKLVRAGEVILVAPDAGATPKVQKIAEDNGVNFIQAAKLRDPKTGQLSGFDFTGNVEGKRLLIVDDICDGGGTFVGLTKELLAGGAEGVDLYVSHGIFSKGIGVLFNGGIGNIYTSDTIAQSYEAIHNERVTILPWS